MTFDTTLSGLDLERKRLEVEKLKLDLLDEEAALKRIMGMRPMAVPPPMPEIEEHVNLGTELISPYRITGKSEFDGSAADKPLICWIRSDSVVDESMVRAILKYSMDLQLQNALDQKSSPSAEEGETAPEEEAWEVQVPGEENSEILDPPQENIPQESVKVRVIFSCSPEDLILTVWNRDTNQVMQAEKDDPYVYLLEPGAYLYSAVREGYVSDTSSIPIIVTEENAPELPVAIELQPRPAETEPPAGTEPSAPTEGQTDPTETQAPEPSETTQPAVPQPTEPQPTEPPAPQPGDLGSCYVIFKTTTDNMSMADKTLWQGLKITRSGSFSFFNASGIPDYTMAADLGTDSQMPDFDMGSGFTAAQIAEMRIEQEKKVEKAKLDIKMAEADYKIKKRELEDGNIYAQFDGKVVSLLEEEKARQANKPIMKVSGGGGFQIEGSVNELDRENMKIGQPVTVNDWNTGGSYDGKIIAIGDFPVRSRGYSGRGNPSSSYYPFTVFVDGEADLQTGSYVSIQYAPETENGIYLSNPFIREEKGQSFVYVLGKNDRLEKRTVTTGKALWGSYTEITSGITEEDYIAFPYGKNVKPGVKAREGTSRDLYG